MARGAADAAARRRVTGAALAQGGTLLTRAPIELRVEDRLQSLPIRRMSAAMIGVVAGSMLVHLGLMAGAMVVARAPLPIPQEKEIAVEVVQEAPKPPEPKRPEPKIEQAKLEPPRPEPVKAVPPKPETAKPEPAKLEQAKPQLAPPPAQKAAAPDAGKIRQLQDELASLRAEQAALKSEEQAQAGSGKAVALATTTDGDGEMVDYQLLVFSQLAKAKEHTSFKGGVGTTGVKFMIDEAGKLARAEIVTPSGDAALDREALAIVSRAAPFPPPPKDAERVVFANVNFVAPETAVTSPDPTSAPAASAMEPLVPRITTRDRVLPILVGVSVFVHATIFLPSLLRGQDTDAKPPVNEIPVEVVQLPPPPKPAEPKPPAPKQPPQPPAPKQAEQKPAPRKVAEKPKPLPEKKVADQQKPPQKSVAERMKDLLGPMPTTMPAVALPGSSADGTDATPYTQLVLSKVAKAKKEGSYKGVPGAASVSFTLGDSGEVTSVQIVHASGDPSLDAEAIAMIKRGAPYPAPPTGGRRDYTITLRFQALI